MERYVLVEEIRFVLYLTNALINPMALPHWIDLHYAVIGLPAVVYLLSSPLTMDLPSSIYVDWMSISGTLHTLLFLLLLLLLLS